jgi:hypothetical protein
MSDAALGPPPFLPRSIFSLGSLTGQGAEEILFLKGRSHSPAFNDMSSLKYHLKCTLANLGNFKGFFGGWKVRLLSELSKFMNHYGVLIACRKM